MMKWLLIAAALVVLYKLITNTKERKKNEDSKAHDKKVARGEMVKDPVCGCYVETEGSISVKDGNITHRFCSYDCRERFLEQVKSSGRAIPEISKDDDD